LTAVEFVNLLMSRGFPLSEIDNWNTGMLIDWAREHDRQLARARGQEVFDPYEDYLKLKAMEPEIEEMHAAGQLREAKYKSYRETLDRYERQLKG
jgi:hypothetical protein